MKIILKIAKTTGIGFLYGYGLALGIYFTAYILYYIPMKPKTLNYDRAYSPEVKKPTKLELINSKAILHPYAKIEIIGTIENKGDKTSGSFGVIADLFDKNDNFIGQDETWIFERVKPKEKINFKISSFNSNEEFYDTYSYYKLKIVER